MNKKTILIAFVAVCILLILVVVSKNKKNVVNREENVLRSDMTINEVEGNYILYNKDGEEIVTAGDKGAFEIYLRNKDYNPQIPIKESKIEDE